MKWPLEKNSPKECNLFFISFVNFANLNRKGKDYDDFQKDHLPFGTMLLKIAASMPNAPKKAELNINLKSRFLSHILILII